MDNVIGRTEEKRLLEKILKSGDPELVVIYGRRRIGKTFLIRNVYQKELILEFSGIHHATLSQQLESFSLSLTKMNKGLPISKPESWIQAFKILSDLLAPKLKKQRKVIFFDEFPWINTSRSGFLSAFENFWNTWASKENNLVVVICGSAAAWMIQKVIRNRGGLHNRVTIKIRLLPFTLSETEAFFKAEKVNLDQYQILQLYMAMGGVPQYLKQVEPGESAAQAIDKICFTKDGLLYDEFKNLYHSLFDDAANHINIIRALAQKGSGLTRSEIIDACKLSSGGGTTQLLEELTESGFISPYIPFKKNVKDCIYKLTDEYSLFYIKFIENSRSKGPGTWIKFSTGNSWKSWSGYAFESICMKHLLQLKKALGIENVYTETSIWRHKSKTDEPGAQIDLLIDRRDHCINICEMKFSTGSFELTKAYTKELDNKLQVFREQSKTRKALFLTAVTTYGVKNSKSFAGLVQSEVNMAELFK
ncbi:MAG TPA: ATP-binding protein [Pedobacter sp.]